MAAVPLVLAAVALVAGTWAAFRLAPRGPAVPAAGWFADPSAKEARRRYWDGRAWTGAVADGHLLAELGHRFRGRFWGPWAGWLAGAVVVVAVGTAVYRSTGEVPVIVATSLLGMAGVCAAFYGFVDRQLGLSDAIRPLQVALVTVASSGAALLVAATTNTWVIETWGIGTATATVGFVEETTKLLVPLALFLLGAYRDPRAGIGLGLASGFGFAITETTQYAVQLPQASGPSFCAGVTVTTDPAAVATAQVARIFLVSPLHWLWTGIAVAIAWRLWHLYGRRGTPGAVGGFLLVMVVHSLNDSSATATCGADLTAATLLGVAKCALLALMYLVFRAWARKSTPPTLIGRVTRAWAPKHLPRPAAAVEPDAEAPATAAR